MSEHNPTSTEPWPYTMTAHESRSWRTASQSRRRELLEDMAGRAMCEAIERGCNRFEIFDSEGELVATGKLTPGDISQIFDLYRSQNRSS
jgi:hypothetical protein